MINGKAATLIANIASKLESRKATGRDEQALLGTLLGALYALQRAVVLGFIDRTGNSLPDEYSNELSMIARQISLGENVTEDQWLAGFYLNSAIHRLAALNERLTSYIFGCKKDVCTELRLENNKFKHDVEGLLSRRQVGIDQAVSAASLLGNALHKVLNAS